MAEFTRRRGYEGDAVEAGEEEDEEEGLFLYHDGSDDDFTREDDAQDCYRPLADGGDDDGDDGDDGDGFDAFDGEVQQQAKEEQELELLRSVREGRSQTNAGSSQQQQQQQRQQHRDTYKVATFGQSVASHEPAVSLMPMRRTTPGVPQLPSSMLLAPSCGIQSLVSAPAGAEAGGTPPLASSRSGSRQFLLPELNESAERRSPLVDSTLEDMRAALQLNQEYQLFIREQLRRIEAAQLRNQELQVSLARCIVHHSTPCLTRSLAFSLSLSLSLSLASIESIAIATDSKAQGSQAKEDLQHSLLHRRLLQGGTRQPASLLRCVAPALYRALYRVPSHEPCQIGIGQVPPPNADTLALADRLQKILAIAKPKTCTLVLAAALSLVL